MTEVDNRINPMSFCGLRILNLGWTLKDSIKYWIGGSEHPPKIQSVSLFVSYSPRITWSLQ